MVNASMLLETILESDEVLAQYLDDIRDMRYVFDVSDDRAHRNIFSREVRASEARSLRACPVNVADSDRLVAALRTVAMRIAMLAKSLKSRTSRWRTSLGG